MVIESEIQRATASGQAAPTPTKMRQTWKCVACGGQHEGLHHLQTAAHKSNMEKLREAKMSQLKRKQPLADERTEQASRPRTSAVATSHCMPGPLAASTNETTGRDEDQEQNAHESGTRQLKRKLTQFCSSSLDASWSSQTEPASTRRRMLGPHVYCMSEMKQLDDKHQEKPCEAQTDVAVKKRTNTRTAERTEPTSVGRADTTVLTSVFERGRMQDEHEQHMHEPYMRPLKRKQTSATEAAEEELFHLTPQPLQRMRDVPVCLGCFGLALVILSTSP